MLRRLTRRCSGAAPALPPAVNMAVKTWLVLGPSVGWGRPLNLLPLGG